MNIDKAIKQLVVIISGISEEDSTEEESVESSSESDSREPDLEKIQVTNDEKTQQIIKPKTIHTKVGKN